jgi:hypothetical protein
MSSPSSKPDPVAKAPFLGAAAVFLAVAGLVFALAIKPLGAAELLGLFACIAAASAFATIPFAIDFARASTPPATQGTSSSPSAAPAASDPAPQIDTDKLAAQIADIVEARLAALDQRRHDEILRAAIAARPAPVEPSSASPVLNSDQIAAPASTAKPRLGRGLASLIHNPAALAKPCADVPAPEQIRENDTGEDDQRAAA